MLFEVSSLNRFGGEMGEASSASSNADWLHCCWLFGWRSASDAAVLIVAFVVVAVAVPPPVVAVVPPPL